MVAYTKPQQFKKEESERLRGERDQIKFINLRFQRSVTVVIHFIVIMDIFKGCVHFSLTKTAIL